MGFRVIRLPPYHCNYNPIEMAWAWVKNYVKERNTTQKLADVKQLFSTAVEAFTPEQWRSNVQHVQREVEQAWEKEGLADVEVEEFLICLGAESDSEEDDWLETSDDEDEDFGCRPLPMDEDD